MTNPSDVFPRMAKSTDICQHKNLPNHKCQRLHVMSQLQANVMLMKDLVVMGFVAQEEPLVVLDCSTKNHVVQHLMVFVVAMEVVVLEDQLVIPQRMNVLLMARGQPRC